MKKVKSNKGIKSKPESNKLTILYKNHKVILGPGETTDLISMMTENWPSKYSENADIAKLNKLDTRGQRERKRNKSFSNDKKK